MRSATFDTDAEGWTTTNGSLVWQAAGGDPGGNLRGVEGGSGLWGFQAGAEFLGDLSSHIGGTLSFDLKQDIATAQVSGADVVIVAGDGTTLVADIGPNPGTDWTSYSVIFGLGGNWRVDSLNGAVASRDTIAAVFSDIASFYIRGEFVNGITGDAANLDNVVLSDPGPPPSGSGNRIASTFESGIDGWSFINDVREFRHVASGGKSGGYLESVDYTTGEIWYFAAADKFLGNKSAFYNGVLSWEQKQSGAGSINEPDIVIGTTGLTLFLDVDTPTTDWSHYAIAFNDQMGWRVSGTNALATEAEIRTVLADLQFLHIRGEFISGADTGGLDNVVLERPARTYLYSDATQATQLGAFGNLSAAIAAASPGNFIDVNQPTLSASLSPIVVRADGLTVQVAGPYTQQLKFFSGVDDITIAGSGRMDILGWNAADRITGGRGNDTLNGAVGNDTLTGGLGADSLIGGRNNDTYVNPTGDTIVELADEGTDTVQSNAAFSLNTAALANVERLALTGTAAITGTGNALANLLTGNAGRNTLSGLAGSDTLMGGDGDDSLAGGDNDDVLAGGAGNDTLLGQSGADALNGGAGDDTYVDPTGDTIVDTAGLDTVRSGETFSLAALPMIENLTLTGSAAISGIGNDGANVLTGGTGANLLDGGLGNDTLNGGSGDDTLMGGNGADVFNGGAGRDTHDLGSDSFADTVLLSAVSESTGLTRDLVIGIDLDGEDRFDLPFAVLGIAAAVTTGALNAASFTTDLATALGAAALPGRNAVLFDPDSGDMNFADTVYLVIDANNTAGFQAGADYVLELRLPSGPLTPDDFI